MPKPWQIVFRHDGTMLTLYDDAVQEIMQRMGGDVTISRASHVEFNHAKQGWEVLQPLEPMEPLLTGCFARREDALKAERAYIFTQHKGGGHEHT